MALSILSFFFFFNDTATTEIYTLSLHDALPISKGEGRASDVLTLRHRVRRFCGRGATLSMSTNRSEEHTSELQSQSNLVCRLLLEKKKNKKKYRDVHLTDKHQVAIPKHLPDAVV